MNSPSNGSDVSWEKVTVEEDWSELELPTSELKLVQRPAESEVVWEGESGDVMMFPEIEYPQVVEEDWSDVEVSKIQLHSLPPLLNRTPKLARKYSEEELSDVELPPNGFKLKSALEANSGVDTEGSCMSEDEWSDLEFPKDASNLRLKLNFQK